MNGKKPDNVILDEIGDSAQPPSPRPLTLIPISAWAIFNRGKEYRRTWRIGRLEIRFSWRSKKNLWGRFGGGWNWKLGVQAASTTVLFSLLIVELTFALKKKEEKK